MPRVFISYSHDSPAHCDRVLVLAQQLRRNGIDADLDQFHTTELLHWPRWCEERMRPENADFVLCVCTAEYARRVEGRTDADVGKGVFWEATLIYNELYDAKGNPRCLPVLLDGAVDADIPNTRAIRDTQAEQGALLKRIAQSVLTYRRGTLHQLKPPPPHFTGRGEALAELCEALGGGGYQATQKPLSHRERGRGEGGQKCMKAVVITAVNGMGGVGKTALALMAGHALREDYPDMQLLLELLSHSPNPVSAGQVRDSVLLAANPLQWLPDDEVACWRLYANLFHNTEKGQPLRALVIIDDAADDNQVERLSPPPGCALLVTSRRQLRTGQPLHLDSLPRADAMALLHAYAPRLDDTQADSLATQCGDLPVALKTAGGYLKAYRSKQVAEYLAELERNRLRQFGECPS